MQRVSYKDGSIDRVINGQVPITVPWNVKHSKRTVLVDSNVFAARKCEIDPLRQPTIFLTHALASEFKPRPTP